MIQYLKFPTLIFTLSLLLSCGNSETPAENSEAATAIASPNTTPSESNNNTSTNPANSDVDEKIGIIRTQFQEIESQLDTYERRILEIGNPDDDAMVVTGYYTNGSPVKMVSEFAQGHGAESTSYYLKDGQLFFVFIQRSHEASIMGPFTDEEERLYISEENVIRLLQKKVTYKMEEKVDLSKIANVDKTAEVTAGMVTEFLADTKRWKMMMDMGKGGAAQ